MGFMAGIPDGWGAGGCWFWEDVEGWDGKGADAFLAGASPWLSGITLGSSCRFSGSISPSLLPGSIPPDKL